MAYDFDTLAVRVEDGVACVAIDHPPLNLLDGRLAGDLSAFAAVVRADPEVRVIVFESADPDFFVAHGDLSVVEQPEVLATLTAQEPGTLAPLATLFEAIRTLPQVTIGKVAGRARGAGAEFLLALDLRFAARRTALFGQPEAALGLFPGAGGTQHLPRLTGRARALEIILGGAAFDADLAERYGWINRALPAAELDAFVAGLARRIASRPAEAVALAVRAVDASALPLEEGLLLEDALIRQVFTSPEALTRMKAALAAGVQTRPVELDLEAVLP